MWRGPRHPERRSGRGGTGAARGLPPRDRAHRRLFQGPGNREDRGRIRQHRCRDERGPRGTRARVVSAGAMSVVVTKSRSEIERMERANGIVLSVLRELRDLAKPGMTTMELERHADRRIREEGARS